MGAAGYAPAPARPSPRLIISRSKMSSKERESIIERLLKIKALAESGLAGERSTAERLLNSLMLKYSISPEDLDSDVAEYHLAYAGDNRNDIRLFFQVAHRLHKGPGKPRVADIRKAPKAHKEAWAKAGLGPKNANVGIYCTKAEFVEVLSTFEIYKEDMHRQEDAFYYAYLDKNELLIESSEDQPEPTEDEIKKLRAAALMAEGIERKNIYKQIQEE